MNVIHIKTPDGLSTGMGTELTNADGARMLGVKRAVIASNGRSCEVGSTS